MDIETLIWTLQEEGFGLWLLLFAFWFGACWGSFLQACYHRIPRGISIVHPPSRCPDCQHLLSWWENQPVLGWCALRGRCRHCGVSIPFRYLWVELLCGALAAGVMAWSLYIEALSVETMATFLSLSYLFLLMSKIDLSYGILPDVLTLSPSLVLLWCGLEAVPWAKAEQMAVPFAEAFFYAQQFLVAIFLAYALLSLWLSAVWVGVGSRAEERCLTWGQSWQLFDGEGSPRWLWTCGLGVMLALGLHFAGVHWPREICEALSLSVGALLMVRVLARLFTTEEALGLGDVKFVALMALLFPPYGWVYVLGLACVLGVLCAIVQFGFKWKASLPFGPCLCLSTLAYWCIENLLLPAGFNF